MKAKTENKTRATGVAINSNMPNWIKPRPCNFAASRKMPEMVVYSGGSPWKFR
jgi:hypothetical protein